MIDLGLTTGIKELWQENLLRDYTLVVEGCEFQVHKVVLAAVSKYFKAMLGKGYMESKMDKVEVKGFSADIIGKLLEFIYTGEECIITGKELEILRCAMYLQVPLVSQFCVRKLMEDLTVHNCLETVTVLTEYPFKAETEELKMFIQKNWETVMENCSAEGVSYEALQVLVEFWQGLEWDMFLFIKNWICSDLDNHINCVDDLMSQVRFCLIGPQKLQAILETDLFSNSEGPWCELVVNAAKYHQLPINLKVIDKSEQSKVRKEPSPVFMTLSDSCQRVGPDIFSLDKENKWQKDNKSVKMEFAYLGQKHSNVCLEVNEFLINCNVAEEGQEWHIFDVRTLSWSKMTNMKRPRMDFEMVYHNNHLYTLGGRHLPGVESEESEKYNFLTDRWSSISGTPVPVRRPSSRVFGDTIYISGGLILSREEESEESDALYCMNLSDQNPIWERKSPSLCSLSNHTMSVMKKSGEDAIFVMESIYAMQWYLPAQDQWSWLDNVKPHTLESWFTDCIDILIHGNVVFIVSEPDNESEDGEDVPAVGNRYPFWKWLIPEYGSEITEMPVEDWKTSSQGFISAMLAIPP